MLFRLNIGFFILCNFVLSRINSQENNVNNVFLGEIINDYVKVKYPNEFFKDYIYIGINRQKLYYFSKGKLKDIFVVSTSKNGAGNNSSSNQTPVGLHFIKEKIGADAPIGTLFKNKKNTGKIVEIHKAVLAESKDEITSRILSLYGKEEGVNKGKKIDTFSRGIYIHGTSEEGSLGNPSSHGCVRMNNSDIIYLFEIIKEGTLVVLIDN
jgi:hypothetical protein